MNTNEQMFDDVLFNILKESKTLPNFLDAIFGFLQRRTDFYVTTTEPTSPVGLPKGWAETFIKNAFLKWKPLEKHDWIAQKDTANHSVAEAGPSSSGIGVQSQTKQENSKECTRLRNDLEHLKGENENADLKFQASESYNGAVYENYSWSQNITDVDIVFKIPDKVITKNITVEIGSQNINVKLKQTGESLLSGNLCQKVKYNDALWDLDKKNLEIHLDKVQEKWWDCLFQNEPKLDVTKIDCSRPFETLPDEAQAKLQELAWNHGRKMKGLPTSDELAMEENLKKAWNARGSPFSGPFDISKVQLD